MMKKFICSCVLILSLFAYINTSFAKFNIVPQIALREEYNDNIFLTASDKEHDYISVISPGLLLEYSPNSALDLSLDYALNFRFYSRNGNLNNTSIKETQNIIFKGQARPVKRVFIDVTDTYSKVPIDVRRRVSSENVSVNMTENNVFTISPYTILPLSSTLSTRLGYKYDNTSYSSDQNTDSERHSAFLTLNKKFSSKLNGEITYTYYKYIPESETNSDVIKDYNSHRGTMAASYQITPDFSVNGEIGKAKYNYKSGRDLEADFWNINSDYRFRITESTSLTAGYSTSLKDSSTSGVYKGRRFDVIFKTGKVLKLSVDSYHSTDKYLRADREDRAYGITASIMQPLTPKINLLIDGLWERQKFLPKEEKIRRYNAGINLDYRITQKITAGLGYRNNNRNSSTDTKDFTNNIISLQAKLVF